MRKVKIISNEIFKQIKLNYDSSSKESISISYLSRKYNVDRKTIRKYLNIIKENNDLIYKGPNKVRWINIESYHELIEKKLSIGCKKIHIYNFLKSNYSVDFSYQYFTLYLREKELEENTIKKSESRLWMEGSFGCQAQVDWKENFTLHTKDNKKITFNIFLYKLSFSRKVKLFLTFDKKQDTVIRCLINAFKELHGVPNTILFDNMKTVIYQPSNLERKDYVVNPKFREFSKDCNFSIYPCKVHRPQTKGKVEALAKCIDALKVYNYEINGIEDLKKIVVDLENEINNRVNRSTGFRPNILFINTEIKELQKNKINPLIIDKYLLEKVYRKVNNTFSVSYLNNLYSVPHSLIGQEVGLTVKNNKLEIDYNGVLICTHDLIPVDIKYQKSYKQKHLEDAYIAALGSSHHIDEIKESTKQSLEVMKFLLNEKIKENEKWKK